MKKFILGYPLGVEPIIENLKEYATKAEAEFNTDEWCEVSAESLTEAQNQFEIQFLKWQQNPAN